MSIPVRPLQTGRVVMGKLLFNRFSKGYRQPLWCNISIIFSRSLGFKARVQQ